MDWTEREKGVELVWWLVLWYLEEKGPVAVDSPFNETNWDNIRLKLHLQLAEVKHPQKFVQVVPFHCSAHGIADQPVRNASKSDKMSHPGNLQMY